MILGFMKYLLAYEQVQGKKDNPEPMNVYDISERRLAGSSGAPIAVSKGLREFSRTKGENHGRA